MGIPYHKRLSGHSDADVLTHAIIDAVLGSVGESDIGTHFPDIDPKHKGASSIELLKSAVDKAHGLGYRVINIDSVVICEEPKLNPFIPSMKEKLAVALMVSSRFIGIKATTNEGMGFVGRGEGIAAQAVVLMEMAGE